MAQEFVYFPADAEVKPTQVKLQRRIHSAVQLPRISNVQLQGTI